jgi:hypothetical protein
MAGETDIMARFLQALQTECLCVKSFILTADQLIIESLRKVVGCI